MFDHLFAAALGCIALVPLTVLAKCDGPRISAYIQHSDPEHSLSLLAETGFGTDPDLCPVSLFPGDTIVVYTYLDGIECHGGIWGMISMNGFVADTAFWPFPMLLTYKITAPGNYRIRGGQHWGMQALNMSPTNPELSFTVVDVASETIQMGIRGLIIHGPRQNPSMQSMRTTLWENGTVPHSEPYSELLPDGNEAGGQVLPADATYPYTYYKVVDWVRLELYADEVLSSCVARTNALLINSGKVRSAAYYGASVSFDALPGTYYLRVVHRNHLPVTFGPLQLDQPGPCIDLASAPVLGEDTRVTLGGMLALRSGNAHHEEGPQRISYVGPNNDRDAVLQRIGGINPNATVTGYYNEDVNMDGVVQYTGANNDRDVILQAIGGLEPTEVVSE